MAALVEEYEFTFALLQIGEGFKCHVDSTHIVGVHSVADGLIVATHQRFFIQQSGSIDNVVYPSTLAVHFLQGFAHLLFVAYIRSVHAARIAEYVGSFLFE